MASKEKIAFRNMQQEVAGSVKKSSLQSLFRMFMFFARAYPARGLMVVVILIFAGLAEGFGLAAVLPLLNIILESAPETRTVIDGVILGTLEALGMEPTIGSLLAFIVAVILLKCLFLIIALSQVGYFSADITKNLRLRLLNALVHARWEYFSGERTGNFAAALSYGVGKSSSICIQFATMMAKLLQVTVFLILAYLISWWVTLAAIGVGLISILLLSRFVVISRRAGEIQTELMRGFTSRVVDSLNAIKPIKAMNKEDKLRPLLEHDISGLNIANRRAVMSSQALRLLPEPIATVALALGLYLAVSYFDNDLGVLFTVMLLFSRSVSGINAIQNNYKGLAAGEQAFWFIHDLSRDLETAAEESWGEVTPVFDRAIALENVSFGYDGKPVLVNASLTITRGGFVALTGASGTGKTTAVDLVIGLLRPQQGQVTVDGIDMNDIDVEKWRQMIGYVPQDTFLFHDTIYSNVALGDEHLECTQVEEALRLAGARDFIAELEAGFDTVVGERGMKFSGGQRQRIAIARALVRKPRLLILDEATTSLDPQTEGDICSTLTWLKNEMGNEITIIAISHQPAIVRTADQVFTLTDGTFIDSGGAAPARPKGTVDVLDPIVESQD